MTTLRVQGGVRLEGELSVPGDKSISHRALMLAAVAEGSSSLGNLSPGSDVSSTIECLEAYGATIGRSGQSLTVTSQGIEAWREPPSTLDCGNSGTTMRMLAGLAARLEFESVFDGDESLRRRPMERVAEPLRRLGAGASTGSGGCPPLRVRGGHLKGAKVETQVASAQVKSAVLLAALGARGATEVLEPMPTRDHTERLLDALGAPVEWGPGFARVAPWNPEVFDLEVPGDVSSGYFLLAAAACVGRVKLSGVGLNPGRLGFLEILERMGARVEMQQHAVVAGEPTGSLEVECGSLRAVEVEAAIVPRLHDELPLFAVLASQAEGKSVVTGAEELRTKESDRISATCTELAKLGADIEELPDGFIVRGPTTLRGGGVGSHSDHRIAMALAVAGVLAEGETTVSGFEHADVSWPGFDRVLNDVGVEVESK